MTMCRQQFHHPDHPNERFYCTKYSGHDYGHLTYVNGVKTGWGEAPKPVYREWFLGEWQNIQEDARYRDKVTGDFSCAKIEGYNVDKTGTLSFTVQELAELYVILSGNHDIPEVYLNKVATALKEAL